MAIVGKTGSGKSTIINLISGLYPISKGRILIDGTDITEIPPGQLRSNIATVMQDVFLFSRTIGENIIMGKGWDEHRFQQVTITHASKFLQRLPDGADQRSHGKKSNLLCRRKAASGLYTGTLF